MTYLDLGISFVIGGFTGFGVAVAIARHKMARIQDTARRTEARLSEYIRDLSSEVMEMYDDVFKERDLNEGLQAELYDAAVPKAKRIG